ncbi:MAG: hypothetical protein KF830_18670, partial [Planctomycetes bacterium]|nr:hypothetical protein [Planctomycetota bacterium]
MFAHAPGHGVEWHEHEELTDADVQRLVRRIRDRAATALRRAGKWWSADDAADVGAEPDGEQQLLLALASGAVKGREAMGDRAGERDQRVGGGSWA